MQHANMPLCAGAHPSGGSYRGPAARRAPPGCRHPPPPPTPAPVAHQARRSQRTPRNPQKLAPDGPSGITPPLEAGAAPRTRVFRSDRRLAAPGLCLPRASPGGLPHPRPRPRPQARRGSRASLAPQQELAGGILATPDTGFQEGPLCLGAPLSAPPTGAQPRPPSPSPRLGPPLRSPPWQSWSPPWAATHPRPPPLFAPACPASPTGLDEGDLHFHRAPLPPTTVEPPLSKEEAGVIEQSLCDTEKNKLSG